MEDGILLATVEGLGHSPFVASAGEIWELLQGEKEEVCRDLLADGPLFHSEAVGLRESEASETNGREIEWRHRGQLEGRLREVNDALDRLMDGGYGRCTDCGEEIDGKRLAADPAAHLCFACQRGVDGETRFRTM
jgi:RNA polymerase-binding transcription factor DksA